ncbi:MAG: hypothetical protein V3V08_19385 [Nannocystaceae bacterium]
MSFDCPYCHSRATRVTRSPLWKLAVVLSIATAMPLAWLMLLGGPAFAPPLVLVAAIAAASAFGPAYERATEPPTCSSCDKVVDRVAIAD